VRSPDPVLSPYAHALYIERTCSHERRQRSEVGGTVLLRMSRIGYKLGGSVFLQKLAVFSFSWIDSYETQPSAVGGGVCCIIDVDLVCHKSEKSFRLFCVGLCNIIHVSFK